MLAAQEPSIFVTSREVEASGFLGNVCAAAGCVFVDRRNRRNTRSDMESIAELLRQGLVVSIFQGTHHGFLCEDFKSPLFEAAILSGIPLNRGFFPTST